MDCTRNKLNIKQLKSEIIVFFKSLGIEIHTTTKALGHQGFFRLNRIDISKNIKEERIIPTLLHEFAHYVIYKIVPICKDLVPILGDNSDILYDELIKITNFIDENSTLEKWYNQKENIKQTIIDNEKIIKIKYPEFKRREKFKPFSKYAKFSDVKHLEKYDAIKVLHWFSYKTYSIINLDKEFPDMPEEFVSYLRLKSAQRKLASVSRKINKMKKYYREPTELFARFIEGLYIDKEQVKSIAPQTYALFLEHYNEDYYKNLRELFRIVNIML